MTTAPDRRAVLAEALRKIDDLSARLRIAEKTSSEPVAVIGMGCRFPGGVTDPGQFWDLLRAGRSGIVRVPAERWDADAFYSADNTVPGTICSREGGFLTGWQPDEFDAEFFSIAPREAAAMDPQQRLLLEVAWEAIENAGIPAHAIRGTQTSVFVGLTANDYLQTFAGRLRPEEIDAYVPFGNASNFAAGRLSYFLGVQGPAVVVDTACSSSLVAVHLACESLRRRESDTALVAGVNLMLHPHNSVALSRFGMLSPTGRCHTFDADADGYVRSEGCGVVVLKRLSDATDGGDRVLAVVRGTAVNQDGASSGVTVPNGPAQQALMRRALAASRLQPSDIDYVETHGTGTSLGDPIELDALSHVFSDRGTSAPLVLGSVKTNLGHLESAAGIAGFMKSVLSVQHGYIPKHLNFHRLTPFAGEAAARFRIAFQPMPWPSVSRPRRAGVSSFGASGTNAHVVVEEGPVPVARPEAAGPAVTTVVVSGRSAGRIAATAGSLAQWMVGAGASVGLADVAHGLNHHRSRYGLFATVCGRDRGQAVAGLQALAAGRPADGVVGPHEGRCGAGTVFVYSGQGSQWAGMGARLLAEEPVFAAAVAELEPDFVDQVGFSLQRVLAGGERLVGIDRIQPVLVGVQLALTRLWRSYGVEPDAVVGHSMGEVSAAVVAEALTVAEGLQVIATRSRLMARLSGRGAMAMLELDAAATAELIAGLPEVTLAVYASPRQSVIAGPPDQIDTLVTAVAQQDRFARLVKIEVPSHHPIMDPVLPELRAALAGLAPKPPVLPVFSTTYERPDDGEVVFGAEHWAANLRNPVRFSQAVAAAGREHCTFVEISPHPLLTHAIDETLSGSHHHSVATLRRDTDDTLTFHTNLNATHTTRPPATPHPPEPPPVLPATPWQHGRHWITASQAPLTDGAHPLLGAGVTDPTNGVRVWQNPLSPDMLWLGDHVVDGACVLPGAVYAELALAAATDEFGAEPWVIEELCLEQVMLVTNDTVVVTTLAGDASRPRIEIRSRADRSGWIRHATATLGRAVSAPSPTAPAADLTPADPDDLYRRLRDAGQHHGPAFRGIVGLAVSDSGVAHAEVRLPAAARAGAGRFVLHPVMLDIAVQALAATTAAAELATATAAAPVIVLPVRFAGVRVFGDVTQAARATAALAATEAPDRLAGRVTLTSPDGRVLLEIDQVDMAVLGADRDAAAMSSRLFALDWEPSPLTAPAPVGGAVLVVAETGDDDPLTRAARSLLAERAATTRWVSSLDEAALGSDTSWDAVVALCAPAPADGSGPDADQLDAARARVSWIADIVKAVSLRAARTTPRLWIVTRGAQQVASRDVVNLAQTSVRGLARVLTFEHPELNTTLVDVDAASAEALVCEVLAGLEHDEVALRDGQRYVHRLVPAPTTSSGEVVTEARRVAVDAAGPGAFRLTVDQPGRLDGLTPHVVRRIPPQPGQVEVRVSAAALNFSDVLKAMGLYPGLQGGPPAVGGECVGVVSAVGDGVASPRPGQRVLAIGSGTLGSHVTTVADLVVPIPDGLSDSDSATFGVAYLTAWYSLRELARLAPGERVLIHSATGGVGLAAVAIAKSIGARIYATAGSEAKRGFLARLGVEYVGDSRGVAFAAEIDDLTAGAGVDVVLNSLAGEAIQRGVQILAPGGRFIELGKKDVYADAALGLAALARSGSFSVVDLDLNMRRNPQRYGALLRDILARAAAGELDPLPVTEFGFGQVVDAFRLMASAGHTGKILVTMPSRGDVEATAPPPASVVSTDGGYLVVGGLGGLGLVAAGWLAEHGAKMVVLNGRSAPGPAAAEAIAAMRAHGCRVEVITGDIAEAGTAERLVAAVDAAGARLAGVLHSAAVLADEIVLNMSESALRRVFAPKVLGGWRLHEATAQRDLDWWLAFSSAASLVGSPGQGAYAAANSWLDGLVAYRRSRGLPAVAINWGPWGQVGRGQFFADLGFSVITPGEGLAAIELLLTADRSRTGVFNLDARQWFQSFPAAAGSSLFTHLRDVTGIDRRGGDRFRAELGALDAGQRPGFLAAVIAEEIGAVLRSTEPISHTEAMESLGLDSLMALELRNRLEARLGITLPAALVWAYPTIADLAAVLCERLGYPATAAAPEPPQSRAALSDEEMALLSGVIEATERQVASKAGES